MPDTNSNNNAPAAPMEENGNGTEDRTAARADRSGSPAPLPSFPDMDFAGTPTPLPSFPDTDFAGIPTPLPSFPDVEDSDMPSFPGNLFPVTPFPTPSLPSVTYYAQVRFLNASTSGFNLDVYIDGQRILSGSTFATVSVYIQVSDGFHTVTVRRTNGRILYQQTMAFISGEKSTMVILDTASGVTLSKVSDMGCTNVPSGYGCFRVANMSYTGSSFDVRTFNNQIAFSGVSYREVTSYKQTSAGNYTFFVTGSQFSVTTIAELPILVLSAIVGGGSCQSCTVNNPLLTFNLTVRAGRAYTSYIIGNPWSNLFRVFTLED